MSGSITLNNVAERTETLIVVPVELKSVWVKIVLKKSMGYTPLDETSSIGTRIQATVCLAFPSQEARPWPPGSA